jgi:hypothetical protein
VVESAPQILTPFPFNAGVFGRFSGDGRLPSVLQPGSGSFGSTVGAFLTRQFDPGQFGALGRFPGRSAFHAGLLYQINRPTDGVDRGDKTTFFTTFVKPVYPRAGSRRGSDERRPDVLFCPGSSTALYQWHDPHGGAERHHQSQSTASFHCERAVSSG